MGVARRSTTWAIALAVLLAVASNATASPITLDPPDVVLAASATDPEWTIRLAGPVDSADLSLQLRVTSAAPDIECAPDSTQPWCSLLAVSYRGGGSGAMVLDVSDPSATTCLSGCLELTFDVPSNSVMLVYEPQPLDLLLRFTLADPAASLAGNGIGFSRTSADGSLVEGGATFLVPEPATLLLLLAGLAACRLAGRGAE